MVPHEDEQRVLQIKLAKTGDNIVAETEQPGASFAAVARVWRLAVTIRSFSSARQRRRRSTPVIISSNLPLILTTLVHAPLRTHPRSLSLF